MTLTAPHLYKNQRGKHGNRPNKTSNILRQAACLPSNSIIQDATIKKINFLDQTCEQDGKTPLPEVTYRRIYCDSYNYGLKQPSLDTYNNDQLDVKTGSATNNKNPDFTVQK